MLTNDPSDRPGQQNPAGSTCVGSVGEDNSKKFIVMELSGVRISKDACHLAQWNRLDPKGSMGVKITIALRKRALSQVRLVL